MREVLATRPGQPSRRLSAIRDAAPELVVDSVNRTVDTVNMAVADRVDTRQRLIDCAIDVLDRDGLAALGLREVARRAGVSHNAPSRHFPGGYRDLCTAVAAVGFAGLARALEGGTAPRGPNRSRASPGTGART